MVYDRQVTIGPEFFAKAKNDYSDWRWAIVREFMQNCIDAPGSDRIDILVTTDGADTLLEVSNNGLPMDEKELVDKLLALGASGKDFLGTVGGFGKAKEILYFCHRSYQIHSGSNLVVGSGAGYNLTTTDHLPGTKSSIVIPGDHTVELADKFRSFAAMCQWRGEFDLNGTKLETNLRKGSRRRDLGWATVYTNKSFRHRMIIRIDGMPMFFRYVNIDRCVIVEVNRSSGDALQSSRDSLKYDYRNKLDSFTDELTVDKSSALRDVPTTEYFHFRGDKQQAGSGDEVVDIVTAAYATLPQPSQENTEENTPLMAVDQKAGYDDGPSFTDKAFRTIMEARCSHEFIVKNNTGLQVPEHFMPHSFSAYSRKLVSVWVKCLLTLHRLNNHSDTFAVGFILDDNGDETREAEYERTDDYGKVYYINPAVIVKQMSSASRSMKKRWKFNSSGYYMMLTIAAHEFVHGLGWGPHDEGYARKLGDVLAGALARKKEFHPCFR